jgi:hypothetical protein
MLPEEEDLDDDEDTFDLERGTAPNVLRPHPRIIGLLCMMCLTLFFWSYCTEYWQEMRAIEALKRATPTSDACLEGYEAASYSWVHRVLYHASGLQSLAEQVCWEQRRVAAMLSYPNPLHCLVNLFWKTAVGDSPLGHIFSRQSYFIQCVLIITAGGTLAGLVYSLALKLPGFFITLLQLPDLHRRQAYEDIQQQLKEMSEWYARSSGGKGDTSRKVLIES